MQIVVVNSFKFLPESLVDSIFCRIFALIYILTRTYITLMVKHIILWKLREDIPAAELDSVKQGIKDGLEGLVGQVPGLLDVHVHTNGLPTSNVDVMLDSTLESFDALKGYAVHPAHVAVANGKVRPYTCQRSCLDFEI